jgi:Glycosyl hydrolase family 9
VCRVFLDVHDPNNQCGHYDNKTMGICYTTANRPNKFQTHGALIGGPKTATDAGDPNRMPFSTKGYNDWRTDWMGSEEALDYNAGFTAALAAATELPAAFWTRPCGGARPCAAEHVHAGHVHAQLAFGEKKSGDAGGCMWF